MDNEILKAIRERRSIRRFKAEQITDEELAAVLEAGTWAPTGHGSQDPLIFAVQDAAMCARLRHLNGLAMGTDSDPYYGAPTIILVFSRESNPNCLKDGSLVIGNMLLAAHSIGLGACWINRCQEMFSFEDGARIRSAIGVPGDYCGVGCIALGYAAHAAPGPKPRKEGYFKVIK